MGYIRPGPTKEHQPPATADHTPFAKLAISEIHLYHSAMFWLVGISRASETTKEGR